MDIQVGDMVTIKDLSAIPNTTPMAFEQNAQAKVLEVHPEAEDADGGYVVLKYRGKKIELPLNSVQKV